MISISGLSSNLALTLIDQTRDRQIETLRNDPRHSRYESAFRERIASITTAKDFVQDYEVYSFVMRAFDLEDQIFGKGMMRKILESDPDDETSLVNRLDDRKFRLIHQELGFATSNGAPNPNFSNTAWVNQMVDRYLNQVFINENDAQNPTVGTVLAFEDKVSSINNWYQVLADAELSEFFRTALGLPAEMAGLDVDDQKRRLEAKYDITKLADPAERERLIGRYVAISDVLNPPPAATSPVISMLSGSGSGAQIIAITLNSAPIVNSVSVSSLYR